MSILPINPKNPDKFIINQAVKILRAGGILVYPTDTAYALGGKFNSPKVIKKILRIKKRRDEKFTLIASSLSQVRRFFKLNLVQLRLAKKYWPGALSIVVSRRFAVRVPALKIARALAEGAGAPLIATSANVSGEKTPYRIDEFLVSDGQTPPIPPLSKGGKKKGKTPYAVGDVLREQKGKWGKTYKTYKSDKLKSSVGEDTNRQHLGVDLVLDAGRLPIKKTSTVVKVFGDKIEVVREGTVKVDQADKSYRSYKTDKTNRLIRRI